MSNDPRETDLFVTTTAHYSIIGDGQRVSHVLACWIRSYVRILMRWVWQGLALVVIVRTAHLSDRWRQIRPHVVLLLLLLLL